MSRTTQGLGFIDTLGYQFCQKISKALDRVSLSFNFFVLKIFWRKKFLVGLDVGKTAT